MLAALTTHDRREERQPPAPGVDIPAGSTRASDGTATNAVPSPPGQWSHKAMTVYLPRRRCRTTRQNDAVSYSAAAPPSAPSSCGERAERRSESTAERQ